MVPEPGSLVFGPQRVLPTNADEVNDVFAADMDGDGDADVLSGQARGDGTFGFLNRGRPNPRSHTISYDASGPRDIFAADLDDDGDHDVISAAYDAGEVAWYPNHGDGTFGPKRVLSYAAEDTCTVHAFDLDADGDLDVVAGAEGSYMVGWYEHVPCGP